MLNPLVRRMLVVLMAGTSALLGAADYYKLSNTKRLDQDLYRSGEFIVETRNCDHLAIGEEALLKYEGPGEYAVLWEDNSTCEVRRVVVAERV